jgi:hypothetical protein
MRISSIRLGHFGIVVIATLSCSVIPIDGARADAQAVRASTSVDKVLSWLPSDTETVVVARGPFVFTSRERQETNQDRTISESDLAEMFEGLALGVFRFKDDLLAARLNGKHVTLAVDGTRHFRAPARLGGMLYEGCTIAIFSENLSNDEQSLLRSASKEILRTEQIQGQQVSVFQEKLENDLWTIFVAFPSEHVVLVATDETYIEEVLARLQGKKGKRALPPDLAEWKYVDTRLRFWGLRHFDKSQASLDPFSPFGGRKSANEPDERAIGLTFAHDPTFGTSATVTYLSSNPSVLPRANELLINTESRDSQGLNHEFRELAPGVIQGSYSLRQSAPMQYFFFVLFARLGHAIYL